MADTLNVARICPATRALGPGRRFVIWVQGCPFNCAGCVSPDWIPLKTADLITVEDLARRIMADKTLEGITISGGEPMLQARGLSSLISAVRAVKPDLSAIAFSGFTLEQLRSKAAADEGIAELLKQLDVLIDGLYVDGLNDGVGLRGSSNQRAHFLSDRYASRGAEFTSGRRPVEVHLLSEELLMVGVPTREAFAAFLSAAEELRKR